MTEIAAARRLEFTIERCGDTAVVHCSGRLVSGANDRFYREVGALIPESKRIVLEMTELTHMDSSGIGTLVRLYVSAKSAGCELSLIKVHPRVKDLLNITRLTSVLGVK